jgi:hypothetical protein
MPSYLLVGLLMLGLITSPTIVASAPVITGSVAHAAIASSAPASPANAAAIETPQQPRRHPSIAPMNGTRIADKPAQSGDAATDPLTSILASFAAAGQDPVLVGAGDIADCTTGADMATARLIEGIPGLVFTAGDEAYPEGSAENFRDCYEPSWGRFLDRTLPAIGNHEYETAGAAGYSGYFGSAASPSGESWYSLHVGAWHVIVLDSNCDIVGCGRGSRAHVAEGGSRRASCPVHPRDLAPPTLQLWRTWQRPGRGALLAGAHARRRRPGHQRPRSRLRALRAPDARRPPGS